MPYKIVYIVLLSAVLMDLLVPVLIGRKYKGYNHLKDPISALGTKESPVQKSQCLNLIMVGVLFVVFAIGQLVMFIDTTWAHYWYTAGIAVYAIGCILAGIFPEDVQGSPETPSGKIHGIASGIGFIFLILTPLWALWIKDFQMYKAINVLFFISGVITFLLFMLSVKRATGFLRLTGLFQRLNLVILYGVLIINFYSLH